MTAAPALKQPIPPSVIERLQQYLTTDLQSVNTEIIARMQSEVSLIPQMAAHLIAAGGKRLRPMLTLASAKLCQYKGQNHITLAAAVEFIHTATLLHDDVVDDSKKRRGRDTANAVWGNKSSVLVGDFLFSRSFQLMVGANSIEVLRILSNAAAIIAEGEVHQLLTANNLATTEADYLRVISAKTAALFAAACEIGAVIASRPAAEQEALYNYGLNLGLAFQISDDVYDFTGLPGKEAGDDFRDGKVTLPLILSFAKSDENEKQFWKRCIEQQDFTADDFKTALKILDKHDALSKSLASARHYARIAQDALKTFPESPVKSAMLDLADYAAQR
ncbi:MAG: polyprenyl synthetase family protein [Alphaproteobacteria bacterium]|nr:MAG: polyprenyl synthetase family protein [Alphaproteobacteria bacterium]